MLENVTSLHRRTIQQSISLSRISDVDYDSLLKNSHYTLPALSTFHGVVGNGTPSESQPRRNWSWWTKLTANWNASTLHHKLPQAKICGISQLDKKFGQSEAAKISGQQIFQSRLRSPDRHATAACCRERAGQLEKAVVKMQRSSSCDWIQTCLCWSDTVSGQPQRVKKESKKWQRRWHVMECFYIKLTRYHPMKSWNGHHISPQCSITECLLYPGAVMAFKRGTNFGEPAGFLSLSQVACT